MKKIFILIVFITINNFIHAQNVGIGIANPALAKLQVHGAVDATTAIFGGESSGVSIQRNWPGIGYNSYYNGGHKSMAGGYGAVQFLDPGNGYMAFDMFGPGNAGENFLESRRAMVISKEGRVSIGSGDYPTASLFVARGSAAEGTAVFQGTTHRSHFNYGNPEDTYIRAGKNNGTVFINDIPGSKVFLGGKVGINSLDPAAALEVRQNIDGATTMELIEGTHFNRWGFLVASNTGNMWLSHNGHGRGIFNAGSGQYSSISDKRLKTNIRDLTPVLSRLMQLQPVEYDMIHRQPGEQKNIGFLAQDVRTVFPELVQVDDSAIGYKDLRNLHTLNYSGFGVIAIKAIQEQQHIIQSLQKELIEVKKAISELQTMKKNGFLAACN